MNEAFQSEQSLGETKQARSLTALAAFVRNVFDDNASGSDNAPFTQADAGENHAAHAYPLFFPLRFLSDCCRFG